MKHLCDVFKFRIIPELQQHGFMAAFPWRHHSANQFVKTPQTNHSSSPRLHSNNNGTSGHAAYPEICPYPRTCTLQIQDRGSISWIWDFHIQDMPISWICISGVWRLRHIRYPGYGSSHILFHFHNIVLFSTRVTLGG